MSMQIWLDQRAVNLLQELGNIPFTDDHSARSLAVIKKALREAAAEVIKRAMEKSMAEIVSAEAMSLSPKRP